MLKWIQFRHYKITTSSHHAERCYKTISGWNCAIFCMPFVVTFIRERCERAPSAAQAAFAVQVGFAAPAVTAGRAASAEHSVWLPERSLFCWSSLWLSMSRVALHLVLFAWLCCHSVSAHLSVSAHSIPFVVLQWSFARPQLPAQRAASLQACISQASWPDPEMCLP